MYKDYLKALSCLIFLHALGLSTHNHAIVINEQVAQEIQETLSKGNADTVFEYPAKDVQNYEPLTITHSITWNTPATLVLISKEDIVVKPKVHITSEGSGNLILKAGMANAKNKDYDKEPVGTIIFEDLSTPHIHMKDGKVRVYYNPSKGEEEHKFWNSSSGIYEDQISCSNSENVETYMLVNHVRDLQDIRKALFKSYALSQDIDATETIDWDQGSGFRPLSAHRDTDSTQPFSRCFDGNGYTISNLFIDRPGEHRVGLFGTVVGGWFKRIIIENLTIKNAKISGNNFVGILAGWVEDTIIQNVHIVSSTLQATDIGGGLIGAGIGILSDNTSVLNSIIRAHNNYQGLLFGRVHDSVFHVTDYLDDLCADIITVKDDDVTKKTPFGFLTKSAIVCANSKCILGSNEALYELLNFKELT